MAVVLRLLGLAAVVLAALAAAAVVAVTADPSESKAVTPATTSTSTTSSTSTSTSTTTTSTSTTSTTTTSTTAPPPPPPTPPPTPTPPRTPAPAAALCIGDSVMLGAGPSFQNTLGMCAFLDSVASRQYHQAAGSPVVQLMAAGGVLPHTVVVALGNNGYTSAAEIDRLLASLPGVQRVVLVTVQLSHTREWQNAVNAEIRAAAARHPTLAVVADWEAASAGHPDWFSPDMIHISGNPAGAAAYGATILAAL